MAGMKRKVLENRRRQHAFVTAHKRKIRDEINPYPKGKKQESKAAAVGHKIRIATEWASQKAKAQAHLREQQQKHRETIRAHKMRLRTEMQNRR